MFNCWPCAHPSAGNASPSTAPDPVGVCFVCNSLACSPHSGIAGFGKLVCAFCAALQGLTLKTFPLGGQGPGGQGPGGQGSGGPVPGGPGPGPAGAPPPGYPPDPGVADTAAGGAVSYLPEPTLLGDVPPFQSLNQALYELPDLYQRGKEYVLPDEMQPEKLIDDANRAWPELYGTNLTHQSLELPLAAAAVGLVLWTAGVPQGQSLPPEEADLPWLVRVPLMRVAISQRITV